MYATVEKVKEGFEAANERITSFEETAKLGLQELMESVKELQKQLRTVRQARVTGELAGQEYHSFWPTDYEAKQFGELILAAARRKAMGEGVGSGGGVIVPTELSSRIIQKMGQYGKFRKNATVLQMGSDRLDVPKIEADLTIYAPGEGKEITKSDMTFSLVGLIVKKFCALAAISSELEEDSVIAIGEIIGMSIARSMSKKEDLIGFLGDGTSTYFGMTGIVGALLGVDATIGNIKGLKVGTGNAYSELTLEDFEGVVAILPDDADDGAKWYVNRKFFFNVMHKLARGAGAADMFAILSDRKERYFMGYPVEFVSAMPSVEANSQICAILGDLQIGAYLGERRQLEIARSDQRYFESDLIGIRGLQRIDINAYGVGDTSEAGPICGLITAAS